jgi:hypothetical protein
MSMQQLETVVSVESDEIMRGKMRGATDQCRTAVALGMQ